MQVRCLHTGYYFTDINKMLHDINDIRFIKGIHAMVKEVSKEEIVGYTPNGKALLKKDLINRTLKAEDDIKNGRLYSTQQVEAFLKIKR